MKKILILFTLIVLTSAISINDIFGQITYSIAVTTDKTSYENGDIILVTGEVSDILSENMPVSLRVIAPNGDIVEIAQIDVGSDKKFSIELHAGSEVMRDSGTYTVQVSYGGGLPAETTFTFDGLTGTPSEGTKMAVIGTDFMVNYKITGSNLVSITPDVNVRSLIIAITASQDGSLVITLPRSLIDSKISNQDDVFFILIDGKQVGYQETITTSDRTLTIPFPVGVKKIEIIGTFVGGTSNNQNLHPVITLNRIPLDINAGQTVTFHGIVTSNGQPVVNTPIKIMKSNTISTDEILAQGTTNSQGEFTIPWIVKIGSAYDVLNVYAQYGETYENSASSKIQVMVVKRVATGSITLDHLPTSANVGDEMFFSGKLQVNGNPEGFIVYIKDEDPWSSDDLLATAYVNADGTFSANWRVMQVDDDSVVDVYAVFEGGNIYYRFTTCDVGPTNQGGSCTNTIKLKIIGQNPPPANMDSDQDGIYDNKDKCPSSPETYNGYLDDDGCPDTAPITNMDSDGDGISNSLDSCPTQPETLNGYQDTDGCPDNISKPEPKENLNGNEYINFYYSHSFTKNPVVAIVPAPDSYDKVRKYIIPTQEGVMMWNNELFSKMGGDWNVDFIIIEPSMYKFPQKPDIIMDVVTRDEVSGCDTEFGGLAYSTTSRPVNTIICTNNYGISQDTSIVSGIAAHEFIHAMGLGHAFNKDGDLMCSIENGKATCSNNNKIRTPSDFNLVGVAKLYGKDGYKSPNYEPYYNEKFTAEDYRNFYLGSTKDVQTTNESYDPTIQQLVDTDDDVPNWVKNIFIWYGQDQVSKEDLLNAIKFLISKGIIKIN